MNWLIEEFQAETGIDWAPTAWPSSA